MYLKDICYYSMLKYIRPNGGESAINRMLNGITIPIKTKCLLLFAKK
jgi:hypothetical protein